MADVEFGRLTDLPLQDAWTHEAHAFTPWLAGNIDHISEVIGVPLVLTDTEVRVETYAADILARNAHDDSVVLIENQLYEGDHKHLGQIMTYLAGLNAQTVIWIASAFRDPHLAAVRWLNENTSDDFSFFALKLRVVRIGKSPLAPIFEIVEKPNDWSRSLSRRAANARSPSSWWYPEFWDSYIQRYPEASKIGVSPSGASSQALSLLPGQLQLGRAVWKRGVSVYLRGPKGQDVGQVTSLLKPFQEDIEEDLGATFFDEGGWHAVVSKEFQMSDQSIWPSAIDAMHEQSQKHLAFVSANFPDCIL